MGGRLPSEWVGGINRNHRAESIGITGRIGSEYALQREHMIARHLDSDKRAVCTTRQNENQAPTHNNLRQAMPLKTRIEQTLLRKMG